MVPILRLENVSAFYGQIQVLHGINLELPQGKVTALLGANGAGKTTTLRAISNLVKVRGRVTFDGQDLQRMSSQEIVRLGIAHVPQGRGTFDRLTVEENLLLGAIVRSDKREIATNLEQMYSQFEILKKRRHQRAGLLSGGQQQMLAVARALMLRPRLMLLDEPSFGLAPLIVKDLFSILARINESFATTILVVEQNAELALDLAETAYVLETGQVVQSGPAAEIAGNEDIRKSYLGY
jgi:branched-chain amino acid transport system ATP-binding protein